MNKKYDQAKKIKDMNSFELRARVKSVERREAKKDLYTMHYSIVTLSDFRHVIYNFNCYNSDLFKRINDLEVGELIDAKWCVSNYKKGDATHSFLELIDFEKAS